MTETPKRRTDRLTPEQRAEVSATVAAWPPLSEGQRAQVAALFAPYVSKLGSA
jgi:mono/diheme cytochrome c family protein